MHPKGAQKSHIHCNPIFQCLQCNTDVWQLLIITNMVLFDSQLQRGKGKNLITLFWEVIDELRNIFPYTSKSCPKKPNSLQSDISIFRVQHWQLPSLDTYGFVWPDWFLAWFFHRMLWNEIDVTQCLIILVTLSYKKTLYKNRTLEKGCSLFTYSGCGGNRNRYYTHHRKLSKEIL